MKQVVLVPWLEGVDRDTGEPSESASGFSDLRNVVLQDAAVRLRAGLGDAVATLLNPVVCYAAVFEAYGTVCWVVYDPATRSVDVVETDLQGQSAVTVGNWGTLDTAAAAPPRFIAAESYGVLVFAHDEANVTARLATYRYDPAAGTAWDVVQADLDGGGAADVVARGVVQHLGYVWYWGFGSASDPDRPEILRRSVPEDPTTLQAQAFLEFGARLSPIVGAKPVGGALAVFKGSSWFRLDGTVSADFSPQLVDPAIGLVSPHALINIRGTLWWWSPYGPRTTSGAATENVAFPLDLTGNPPTGLPALGPGAYAFTFYDPETASIGFAFPDPDSGTATPVVKVSARADQPVRWSYDVLGPVTLCAVLASTGEASFLIDPGYADPVTVAGSSGSGTTTATVDWTNVDCVGDEVVEIWAQMNGGGYALRTTVAVNTAAPQQVILTGGWLASGTIDVALRHRRLGRYLATYTDPDPSMWPLVSQASGTIVAVATPIAGTFAYDPATGDTSITWTNGDPTQDLDVELVQSGGAPATLVPLAAGTTSYVFGAAASNTARNAIGTITARVRHKIGAVVGTWVTIGSTSLDWSALGGIDGFALALNTYRASVALGTDVTFDLDRPTSQVGNLGLQVNLNSFTYGSNPPNGGCSGMTEVPGQRRWLTNFATVLLATSIPDTDPLSQTLPFTPAVACSTCLAVGQNISYGGATVLGYWAKAGTLVHGHRFNVDLPGGSNALVDVALVTCGP